MLFEENRRVDSRVMTPIPDLHAAAAAEVLSVFADGGQPWLVHLPGAGVQKNASSHCAVEAISEKGCSHATATPFVPRCKVCVRRVTFPQEET